MLYLINGRLAIGPSLAGVLVQHVGFQWATAVGFDDEQCGGRGDGGEKAPGQ